MNLLKTTKDHSKYWSNRKINWNDHYTATWNHPHRQFIIDKLKTWRWISVIEIGCASGPNLVKIIQEFPRADVGGVDINADAINTARGVFNEIFKGTVRNAWFKVNSGDNLMISDESTDVVLSDACLIYVDRASIRRYVREMKRITRNRILLCEFHSEKWWRRIWLKVAKGYHAYDWKKLLEEEGFHNVEVSKIPKEAWSGTPWEEFGYVIVAKK